MNRFIYANTDWPHFKWDSQAVLPLLGRTRNLQGRLTGRTDALGFGMRNEANLEALSLDVIKTSEIEGEVLDADQVRSSIARKLGLEIAGLVESDRHVDGVVEMMLDATRDYDKPLTVERLFGWHSALFPSGRSGMQKIITGAWRNDSTGPMQVVSGPMGKERVHFQAPPADALEHEVAAFLEWFNSPSSMDPVMKAAIAHLWFVTIHPFEDGNGRIARAIADLMLSRAEEREQRFYSMSAQIRKDRSIYYTVLERTQKGGMDVTAWITWFLECLGEAIESADGIIERTLLKHDFWIRHQSEQVNARQNKVLNMLLDGFTGKLTSSKWAKINKCSTDTALRDITDLVNKGILEKEEGGGRSTSYTLSFHAPGGG